MIFSLSFYLPLHLLLITVTSSLELLTMSTTTQNIDTARARIPSGMTIPQKVTDALLALIRWAEASGSVADGELRLEDYVCPSHVFRLTTYPILNRELHVWKKTGQALAHLRSSSTPFVKPLQQLGSPLSTRLSSWTCFPCPKQLRRTTREQWWTLVMWWGGRMKRRKGMKIPSP